LTPTAATSTSTWPAAGSGAGTSTVSSVSGPPCLLICTAFMRA
jgi:hypothetical protein